jgi:hypothetical protein
MWEAGTGPLSLISAASFSLEDDTVHNTSGHLRLESPLAGMRAVVRGDLVDEDGDVLLGGTAGLLASPWILRLQAGVALEPGGDPGIIGAAGTGPSDVFLEYREGGLKAGIQTSVTTDHGFLHAGGSADADTLRCTGILMPALRWGAGGMLYGGVSWELTATDTSTVGTLDARSMFTLGRFAFIFAMEDVLDDWRSYSFGVTWTFSDRRETHDLEDR